MQEIEELRARYGFDQPEAYPLPQLGWRHAEGRFSAISFEYRMPVSDVVGDRVLADDLVSTVTIYRDWLIAFPIGIYSATHQYSWGDYGLTLLGLIGLAVPNFVLALVLMYLANIWFGTSIGH